MSDKELIPVSVVIGDRTYRVRVEPHEEEQLRRTAKLINEKVLEYKTTLAGKDMQDYIAMVMLWFATQPNEAMRDAMEKETIKEGLDRISKLLDKTLG